MFRCQVDGRQEEDCTSPWTATGLQDGAHTLRVRVVGDDYNGHVAGRDASFTVDARAPETSVNVPAGALVDARVGRVAVASAADFRPATDSRHRTQTAELAAAIFTIRQTRAARNAAQTDILMRTPPGQDRACAAATPPRKGIVRTLIGSVKGSYRAIAAAATVTVRDATWTIEDTCNGTRVHAKSGAVRVSRTGRKRAVTVRPGRSYLVKARLFRPRRAARRTRPGLSRAAAQPVRQVAKPQNNTTTTRETQHSPPSPW